MNDLIHQFLSLPRLAHYIIVSIILMFIFNYFIRNSELIEKESKFFASLQGWVGFFTVISWFALGIKILGIDEFFGFSIAKHSMFEHVLAVLFGCFLIFCVEMMFNAIYGRKRKFKIISCPDCDGRGYIDVEGYTDDNGGGDCSHSAGCSKCGGHGRYASNPIPGYNYPPLKCGTGKIIVER